MKSHRSYGTISTLVLALTMQLLTTAASRQVEEPGEEPGEAPAAASEDQDSKVAAEMPIGLVKEKPEGFSVKTDLGYMIPYKTVIPGSDVVFEMVPIPGGTFLMGSPTTEADRRDDEGPQREIVVEPFWMGRFEVTWAEYKLYMRLDKVFKEFTARGIRPVENLTDIDAITAPSSLYDPSFTFEAGDEPDQPAATMSQYAAKQYTKWLSLLVNDFYRLPTEAEWEYACRAGTTTAYYFGDDVAALPDHAWFIDNADEQRHPVGKLKPNPWGLYDIYGNVAEWVLDKYNEDGYPSQSNGQPLLAENALVKPDAVFPRVVRGGSWELEAEDCRSAARLPSEEDWRDEDPNYPQSPWWFTTSPGLGAGFRIIRPLDPPATRQAREEFWKADLERIVKDARNRIRDNGKGAVGLVDPKLPEAIRQLGTRK